ncbi:MAG: hypothetical protein ACM3NQ_05245 [Bacteroidales bacterium]
MRKAVDDARVALASWTHSERRRHDASGCIEAHSGQVQVPEVGECRALSPSVARIVAASQRDESLFDRLREIRVEIENARRVDGGHALKPNIGRQAQEAESDVQVTSSVIVQAAPCFYL